MTTVSLCAAARAGQRLVPAIRHFISGVQLPLSIHRRPHAVAAAVAATSSAAVAADVPGSSRIAAASAAAAAGGLPSAGLTDRVLAGARRAAAPGAADVLLLRRLTIPAGSAGAVRRAAVLPTPGGSRRASTLKPRAAHLTRMLSLRLPKRHPLVQETRTLLTTDAVVAFPLPALAGTRCFQLPRRCQASAPALQKQQQLWRQRGSQSPRSAARLGLLLAGRGSHARRAAGLPSPRLRARPAALWPGCRRGHLRCRVLSSFPLSCGRRSLRVSPRFPRLCSTPAAA